MHSCLYEIMRVIDTEATMFSIYNNAEFLITQENAKIAQYSHKTSTLLLFSFSILKLSRCKSIYKSKHFFTLIFFTLH